VHGTVEVHHRRRRAENHRPSRLRYHRMGAGRGHSTLIFGGGFNVLDENEHNRSGRHLNTGQAAVVLQGGKLARAEIPRADTTSVEPISASDCADKNIMIFQWSHDDSANEFFIKGAAWDTAYHLIELRFSCNGILCCWNDFTGDAYPILKTLNYLGGRPCI
jgi:hypothetical protein